MLPARLFSARLLSRLGTRLLTGLAGLLALLPRTLARLIVARHLLRTIPALILTLALLLSLSLLSRLRLLIAFATLTRLTSIPTGFTVGRLPVLSGLIGRLTRVAFLIGTPTLSVLRITFLSSPRLRDFALKLIGQRIEFGLSELQLLRVVAEHTFGCAFHPAAQLVDFPARRLIRLTRLRKITLLQHLPGQIEDLAALFALRRFLHAIIKIPRHPTTV